MLEMPHSEQAEFIMLSPRRVGLSPGVAVVERCHQGLLFFLRGLGAVILIFLLVGCTQVASEPGSTAQTSLTTTATEPTSAPQSAEATALPPTAIVSPADGLLQRVKRRGYLNCGVDEDLPGFSVRVERDGTRTFEGFDADFCRVVAAAIFGDPEDKVVFFPLSLGERFAAVQTGKVDILFGNVSWTAIPDTELGLNFGPITFYDSLGVMAPETLDISELDSLDGRNVCLEDRGGTLLAGPVALFQSNGIEIEPVYIEESDLDYTAYQEEACAAVITYRSRLYAKRTAFPDPDAHQIQQVAFAGVPIKEPMSPIFVEGDDQWDDVVSWAVFATIQAEEYDIDSDQASEYNTDFQQERDQFCNQQRADFKPFLGCEGAIGRKLGLVDNFALNIVQYVGNYSEIYDRHLQILELEPADGRGPNKPWTRGGLLSSPPFR
jgi:general L-amino acid transport system substrate-binding protein